MPDTSVRLGPAFFLALCIAVIVYLLWHAWQPGDPGPLWYLLAIPAIIAARFAWRRLRRP